MKATLDFDDALYRRLKVEAARRGRTIRDLVQEGVRLVLSTNAGERPAEIADAAEWFGSLKRYAKNASGEHDLASIRTSIDRGRRQ